MIPVRLTLAGFLSYRDPVTLDFTRFDLACISGSNGAGKSSLLDAMLWALFGQARKRDESLIHTHPEVSAAEVSFVFIYEGNLYRVQRSLPRGRSTQLEFQIRSAPAEDGADIALLLKDAAGWKTLTESRVIDTQRAIERTLHLDYETFINASFFLQGKADQFAQQRPGERKRILTGILGLEIWETYRDQAAERRKGVESQISALQGSLAEINAELAEEVERRRRLEHLQQELVRLNLARSAQAQTLETLRQVAATLNEQRRLLEALNRQTEAGARRLAELEQRLESRRAEQQEQAERIAQAVQIEAAYQEWQQARADLERWEEVAGYFREHQDRRQPLLESIRQAQSRLENEAELLGGRAAEADAAAAESAHLQAEMVGVHAEAAQLQALLDGRPAAEQNIQLAQAQIEQARAENLRLRDEMNQIRARMDRLASVSTAECPFCGQPLGEEQRQALIQELSDQGTQRGDHYRENVNRVEAARQALEAAQQQMRDLDSAQRELTRRETFIQFQARRIAELDGRVTAWESEGAPRLAQVQRELAGALYAAETRAELAALDAELKKIGYDTDAHDAARRREAEGRSAEAELRQLERARATQSALERELGELQSQHGPLNAELAALQSEQAAAAAHLDEMAAPDLYAAEQELFELQEQENQLRIEVGGAQQKVSVLADLKIRRKAYEVEQAELARLTARYKQLERAFGKDGVPALLIEQALPQIEARANEILDSLSGGGMAVRFVTQAAYKDKKREDLKETLDIQISDATGTRDYELYSGGEAFRLNFAIRLALSEVLAQRAGARLQMLVVDEGFGSQDTEGRQRLVEAINLVRPDFAKILVITHIDELKDHFPARIEVEKTARGSTLRVL